MRPKKRKYEASIYYQQVEPPDPDYEVYTRLHDVYISMLDVLSAVDYVKDLIRTPPIDDDGDSVFERVLTNHWIPYKLLQWQPLQQTDKVFYQCRTEPFVTANGCKRILRIQVQCLDGKEQLPKY